MEYGFNNYGLKELHQNHAYKPYLKSFLPIFQCSGLYS